MRELVRKGMGILFISSEMEEVARSCDRVIVLRDRTQVGELTDLSESAILQTIAGKSD